MVPFTNYPPEQLQVREKVPENHEQGEHSRGQEGRSQIRRLLPEVYLGIFMFELCNTLYIKTQKGRPQIRLQLIEVNLRNYWFKL